MSCHILYFVLIRNLASEPVFLLCSYRRYTLGNVFDKDYTGQDRSKPYIDHIVIPRQLVPQYAQDGVLQISIELDVQVCRSFHMFPVSLNRLCSGSRKPSNGQLAPLARSVYLGF